MLIFSGPSRKRTNYTCHHCTGAMHSSPVDSICAFHPCASHVLCIVQNQKKTGCPSQIVRVIFVQEPCSSIQTVSRRKRKSSALCRGHSSLLCLSRSAFARNSHLRTSSRGFQRRGGDVSRAVDLWNLLPSLRHQETVRHRRLFTPRRKSSAIR